MGCWCTLAIPRRTKTTLSGLAWASLGILEALGPLNARLEQDRGMRLAVRVGVHTGPVVVGAMGGGGRQEQVPPATCYIAARLQELAGTQYGRGQCRDPGTACGFFTCQTLGEHALKGVDEPLRCVPASGRERSADAPLTVVPPRGRHPWLGVSKRWGCSWSAGRRVQRGMGRSCCSAARRALASRAWSRCCGSASGGSGRCGSRFAVPPTIRTARCIR